MTYQEGVSAALGEENATLNVETVTRQNIASLTLSWCLIMVQSKSYI